MVSRNAVLTFPCEAPQAATCRRILIWLALAVALCGFYAVKEKLVRISNLLEFGRFASIGDRNHLGAVVSSISCLNGSS